jgi:hypothetical protein
MECDEIIDQVEAARMLGVRPKVLEGWRARKINCLCCASHAEPCDIGVAIFSHSFVSARSSLGEL